MRIGILGGSGLYDIKGLRDMRAVRMSTPFGAPSDRYVGGKLGGCEVFFLPRHGKGHRILPSEINHRANIYGFKKLGVEKVVSVSAVGSLKQALRPEDVVLPDQYFDRTKQSMAHTFFGNGLVAHVSFGDPTCADLRSVVAAAVAKVVRRGKHRVKVVNGGTYVNMEGPAFSTKAESHTYRRMGFDIIGMTSLPEAKLCREAGMCYQAMAMVTDYDCWHESEDPVTVEMIIGHLNRNVDLAREILVELIPSLAKERKCACGDALKYALITRAEDVPAATLKKLAPIVGPFMKRR